LLSYRTETAMLFVSSKMQWRSQRYCASGVKPRLGVRRMTPSTDAEARLKGATAQSRAKTGARAFLRIEAHLHAEREAERGVASRFVKCQSR